MPILPPIICVLGFIAAVVTVVTNQRVENLVFAGVTALLFAFEAVLALRRLADAGASETRLAEASARRMGFAWAWGALSILVIYVGFIKWHEWWHFFLGFGVAAAASFGLATALARDEAAGGGDGTMLKLGRTLAWAQLIGMGVAVIGLAVDGKIARYHDPIKYPDWAANNLCLAGAAALAALSLAALFIGRRN